MAGRTEKNVIHETRSAPKPAVRKGGSAARIERGNLPVAAELPVTRAMLGQVRTELLERIDQAKSELKAELKTEIGGVKAQLASEIGGVKAQLASEINGVKAEINGVKAEINGVKAEINGVKAEINGVKAQLDTMQAGLHEMKATVARICFLVEEQNARNRIVLDGLTAMIQRQDRQERRMDQVEETVLALASARLER
jgi:chromosome segregation ATPase